MRSPACVAPRLSDRIERIQVSGTYKVVAEAAALAASGVDLSDFGAGEPHFATPTHIKEAAHKAIDANRTHYTAGAGIPALRAAIAERHAKDFGTHYAPENVLVTPGGKLALFEAIQTIVNPGDEVIVPVPYWVSFKDIVEYTGGKCIFVEASESDGFRPTPDQLLAAFSLRTRAIILNSPSNPSGAVMSPADLSRIAREAAKRGIFLILDECYSYLDHSGAMFSAASVPEARDFTIVIGSLSKTYAMTGWRCGYALAPGAIVRGMQKLQSQSVTSVAEFIQYAAIAALTGDQDCVRGMRDEYRALRDRMHAALVSLPGISCALPEGAFYLYPNLSKRLLPNETVADLASALLHEAHIVVVPGSAFGTDAHLRFSYAVSRESLDVGMRRLHEFFSRRS